MPQDANVIGTLFGGQMVSWMDIAAAKAAHRYLKNTNVDAAVTRAIDTIEFTQPVHVGDWVNFNAKIIETPGHTTGHIIFWFEKEKKVFTGDTLFVLGCGKLFEGTPKVMWNSLLKIRNLPNETEIYCGHEYSKNNADFALSIEKNNNKLIKRSEEINKLNSPLLVNLPNFEFPPLKNAVSEASTI